MSGVVNRYFAGQSASLTAGQANTTVTVGSGVGAATPLAQGDLVLIIQMQGAQINSTNTNSYGDGVAGGEGRGNTSTNFLAGRYEYARVASVSGSTIGLTGSGTNDGLNYSYQDSAATATSGQYRYQVIRVPQYSTAVLNPATPPTAPAWNGSVGGIVVLDAANTVDLNGATINVTGLGFRPGLQRIRAGTTSGGFANTDYRTPTSAPLNGQKAEGIAGTPVWQTGDPDTVGNGYPNGDFGRGAPGNAGGGGTDGSTADNGQNSGGGGGGNGGLGGRGGNTWSSNLPRGGNGGATVTGGPDRIVMGGGGGAGSDNNGVLSSKGGAGGGIVLIRSGDIAGSGTIIADGVAGDVSGQDGSGGGGAGGTVAVVTSATGGASGLSGLTINARGGAGGNETNAAQHGPGGGGGGGRVITSATPAAATVTAGVAGIHVPTSSVFGAFPGGIGVSSTTTASAIPGANTGSQCIDLSVTKNVSPTNVVPGQTVSYTVVATNNGPFPVNGTAPVIVSDVVPAALTGVTWTCSATAGSNCAGGTGSLSTTANLALGGVATYTITGTLSPSFTGTLSNTATVSPPSGVPELNPLDNVATVTSVAAPRADLSITKTDGVATATPGTTVTYTIGVSQRRPVDRHRCAGDRRASRRHHGWHLELHGRRRSDLRRAERLDADEHHGVAEPRSDRHVLGQRRRVADGDRITRQHRIDRRARRRDRGQRVEQHGDRLRHPHADRRPVHLEDGRSDVDRCRNAHHLHDRGGEHRTIHRHRRDRHRHDSAAAHRSDMDVRGQCRLVMPGERKRQHQRLGHRCERRHRDLHGVGDRRLHRDRNHLEHRRHQRAGQLHRPDTRQQLGERHDDDHTSRRPPDHEDRQSSTEVPGTSVTYTIVASNPTGPSAVTGATVTRHASRCIEQRQLDLRRLRWIVLCGIGVGQHQHRRRPPGQRNGHVHAHRQHRQHGHREPRQHRKHRRAGPVSWTRRPATTPRPTATRCCRPPTSRSRSTTDSLTEIPGTDVTYTVVATNAGPSAVTGTTIDVTPPSTLTGLTWSCVGAGGAVCPNDPGRDRSPKSPTCPVVQR